jgi:formate--tetrahydrofolate ligase
MRSDLEVTQSASLRDIRQIATSAGIEENELELYGRYKAKIDLSVRQDKPGRSRHLKGGDSEHCPFSRERAERALE